MSAPEPSGELIALTPVSPPQSRRLGAKLALLALVAALFVFQKLGDSRSALLSPKLAHNIAAAAGKKNPPSAAELEAEKLRAERRRIENEERAWREKLSSDRWVHPLPGPKRRMPLRSSRVFGAERPGIRPSECQAGHCGVDIGGEVWGEPILASNDGVVIKANRDPRRSGGKYVRIGHRNETVFTQYFHLAAIPRQMKAGSKIRAGQVIGLLGETGIRQSGAHLHFTVSVRPSKTAPEQFIDPEPLIALWPVAVPEFGNVASIARTYLVPGRPRGPFRKRAKRRTKKAPQAPSASVDKVPLQLDLPADADKPKSILGLPPQTKVEIKISPPGLEDIDTGNDLDR